MSDFEKFLTAFEASSLAARSSAIDWILANRFDDEPDDETGLDADEIAARVGITPEQSARFRRACAEARAFHDVKND
ncbi:MAG: hypothetical protein H6972_10575 [Gammaproteobacteria bacterium]|nr:hypothetical protein [Gammaproteobacteria bacterium]